MVLAAHYDLELHLMDVKATFLNGDLCDDVNIAQLECFVVEGKKSSKETHLWFEASIKAMVSKV